MLRKIKLYGPLAQFIGKRVLQADVASAAEALRFLVANFPAVEKHMADQHYRVTVGSEDLTLDQLHEPTGLQDIKIVPVLTGAGGSTGQILAGAALLAFAIIAGPLGAFASTAYGPFATGLSITTGFQLGSTAALAIGAVGASLIMGGVSQLISPVPTVTQGANSNNDPRKSYSFSGIQQTSRQGTPVPICYGLTLTGSVVISAGIDTVQVKA
jgi:predicted phage tail protein